MICDIAGNRSVSDYKRALKPRGTRLFVGFAKNPLTGLVKFAILGKPGSMRGDKKLRFMGIAKMNSEDMGDMAELMAAGKVKFVIEGTYRLSEVGEALQYISE